MPGSAVDRFCPDSQNQAHATPTAMEVREGEQAQRETGLVSRQPVTAK